MRNYTVQAMCVNGGRERWARGGGGRGGRNNQKKSNSEHYDAL